MLLVPGTAQVLIRHFCYVNIYVKKLCILQHRLVPDSFENITDGWFSHINNLSALYKPDNRTENKVFITFPPA